MPLRAAVYARVSSQRQRDEQTIESQTRELPALVARMGWELVGTYVDDGKSAAAGQLAARTGLGRLLADATARPRPFDVVVVWDVDRLTRSEDPGERGQILGALALAGVKIATYTGGLQDPATSEGDLMLGVQAWAAADWLRKHRARVRAGKARALAAGRKPAGPTPYGLTYDRASGAWGIDPERAAAVRLVYARVIAGDVLSEIARQLEARGAPRTRGGEWSASRVFELVRKSTYRGEWVASRATGATVAVPAIVDDATWYAAQEALTARRPPNWTRGQHVNLCQGLAVCGLCDEPIGVTGGLRSARYYVCRSHKRGAGCPRCGNRMRRIEPTDALVWARLAEVVTDERRLRAAVAGPAPGTLEDAARDVHALEARLARLDRHEVDVLAWRRRGRVSAAAAERELADIARDRATVARTLEAERRRLAGAGAARAAGQALEAAVAELRAAVAEASPEQRQALVRLLVPPGVGRITMRPDAISIAGRVPLPTRDAGIFPVAGAGYRSVAGEGVRFRVVA